MRNREEVVDKVVNRILEIENIKENDTLRPRVRGLEDEELEMWYTDLCGGSSSNE